MNRARLTLLIIASFVVGLAIWVVQRANREPTFDRSTYEEAPRLGEAIDDDTITPEPPAEPPIQYRPNSAAPFQPDCGSDPACAVWASFRKQHPFPYQTIAAATEPSGKLVVILSEPPPSLSKADLEKLVRSAFGDRLVRFAEHRWMIGVDGWVEDVVLTVEPESPQPGTATPLDDPRLRDRVALLQLALFGAATGSELEDASLGPATEAADDLAPTPADLRSWTEDAEVKWTALEADDDAPVARPLADLMASGPIGGYADSEHQLTAFVLPAPALAMLRAERVAPPDLAGLFRRFALSTDVVLGGVLDDARGVAIIGRTRRLELRTTPPLRFETFWQLVLETRGELNQSYERKHPLAGKMVKGEFAQQDWAPILLSPSLVDTELGSLLNVTDQLLKSWSEAGAIEYLYFHYPRWPEANRFVFRDVRLSRSLFEDSGATGVLFNWNTSGAAASFQYPHQLVLVAGHTNALPVTYGSEMSSDAGMQTGDAVPELRKRENDAYSYFVKAGDQNLARVVSYVLMYQVLHASLPPAVPALDDSSGCGAKVLTDEMRSLIEHLTSGKPLPSVASEFGDIEMITAKLSVEIESFLEKHQATASTLASYLGDPRRTIAGIQRAAVALGPALENVRIEHASRFEARIAKWEFDQQKFSGRFVAWISENSDKLVASDDLGSLPRLPMGLQAESDRLDEERAELERETNAFKSNLPKEIRTFFAQQDEFEEAIAIGSMIQSAFSASAIDHDQPFIRDLAAVRARFGEACGESPDGRIKTQSMVISIDRVNVESVGGHNASARVLRIEVDPALTEAKIVEDSGGAVLRVPESQADLAAGRAHELARDIEHGHANGDAIVTSLADAKLVPPKPRRSVLGSPPARELRPAAFGRVQQVSASGDLRTSLVANLEARPEASAILMRDTDGYMVAAHRRNAQVRCCTQFLDSASMHEFVRKSLADGEVMAAGESREWVGALVDSVRGKNFQETAAELGSGGGGSWKPPGKPPSSSRFEVFEPGDSSRFEVFEHGGGSRRSLVIAVEPRESMAFATRPRDFKVAKIGELESGRVGELLRTSELPEWNPAGDGDAFGNVIDFPPGDERLEVYVIAGIDREGTAAGRAVVNEAVAQATTTSDNFSTFYQRIRTLIDDDPRGRLRRFHMIIRSGTVAPKVTEWIAPDRRFEGIN